MELKFSSIFLFQKIPLFITCMDSIQKMWNFANAGAL